MVTPPATPVDDGLVEVEISGQRYRVPLDELKGGYLRQQDYTRKTMQLADMRRQIDEFVTQRQRELQEYQQLKADPRIQSLLNPSQSPAQSPDDVATVGTAKQLVESQAQALQHQFQQQLQAQMAELEVRQLAATYTNEIDATVKLALDKHEVLQDIDGIGELLKRDMAMRGPQSIDQAKQFLVDAAAARSTRLMARLDAQRKQEAAQAATRLRGIESPGGAAPVPGAPQGEAKLGSSELRSQILADLQGLFNKD